DVGTVNSCAIAADSLAWCWGSNFGTSPVAMPGGLHFTSLSDGQNAQCGVLASGQAWCLGDNTRGQLGNGTTTSAFAAPVKVAGGITWANVSAGSSMTCGVSNSGTLYCWGSRL